jgi:ACS family glucarate transporter-like MFS transporter
LVALTFWSIFTIATPLAWGFVSLLIIRFLFGAGEAPLFPNNGSFLQKWFNKHEKALPSGMMLTGGFIAPAIAAPCSVWIMVNWGWQAVFFAYGGAGIIIGLIWYFCMREHPHEHPWVNRAEVDVIGQENVEVVKQTWPVWKHFLSSLQFWSHGFQYTIVCYIWWVYLSWLPMYLLEARGMNLKEMAFANAFPFIAISVGMLAGGKVSDALIKHGYSKAIARTSLTVAGLLICGLCLFLGSVAAAPIQAVIWMSIALLALGFNFTASWAICQDLGRKQTIAVVGWMQIWANISGVFAPTVMAWLVTNYGWQTALNVTASMVIVGAVFAYLIKPDRPLHE